VHDLVFDGSLMPALERELTGYKFIENYA